MYRLSLFFSALILSVSFFSGNIFATTFYNKMQPESQETNYPNLQFVVVNDYHWKCYTSPGLLPGTAVAYTNQHHSHFAWWDCTGNENITVWMSTSYNLTPVIISTGQTGNSGSVTCRGNETHYYCTFSN